MYQAYASPARRIGVTETIKYAATRASSTGLKVRQYYLRNLRLTL